MRASEHCKNPWNGKCKSTEIELYIWFSGRKLPICKHCWEKIADKDVEWGRKQLETRRH